MSEPDDDPATKVANLFAECVELAAAMASMPGWARFCVATPSNRKQVMLTRLHDFIAARSLLDLPEVHGPKDAVRDAMDAAANLERAVAGWDGGDELSPAMMSAGFDFLNTMQPLPPPLD